MILMILNVDWDISYSKSTYWLMMGESIIMVVNIRIWWGLMSDCRWSKIWNRWVYIEDKKIMSWDLGSVVDLKTLLNQCWNSNGISIVRLSSRECWIVLRLRNWKYYHLNLKRHGSSGLRISKIGASLDRFGGDIDVQLTKSPLETRRWMGSG